MDMSLDWHGTHIKRQPPPFFLLLFGHFWNMTKSPVGHDRRVWEGGLLPAPVGVAAAAAVGERLALPLAALVVPHPGVEPAVALVPGQVAGVRGAVLEPDRTLAPWRLRRLMPAAFFNWGKNFQGGGGNETKHVSQKLSLQLLIPTPPPPKKKKVMGKCLQQFDGDSASSYQHLRENFVPSRRFFKETNK